MSLENILTALECSMKNQLEKLNEKTLKKREIKRVLTAHFAEQIARPELTGLIKSQRLMHEYLSLSVEEREELDAFRREHGGYLEVGWKGRLRISYSHDMKRFVRKQRYVARLLNIFDFYLQNREEGDVFDRGCLKHNKKLREEFGSLGVNLHSSSLNNLGKDGGFERLVELACEIRPEIRRYTDMVWVFKREGVPLLIRIFDFFKENREEGDVFNSNYMKWDDRLKIEFGSLGVNLCSFSEHHLRVKSYRYYREGGFERLVELACEVRPEIRDYCDRIEVFKRELVPQLIRIFDFYLKNREERQEFGPEYLQNDDKLREEFGNLGVNLYRDSLYRLEEEGGFDRLMELACEVRPEIRRSIGEKKY